LLDEGRDRHAPTPPEPASTDQQPLTEGYSPGAVALARKDGQLENGPTPAVTKGPWYRTRWGITAIVIIIILIIGGAVGGAVGSTHHSSSKTTGNGTVGSGSSNNTSTSATSGSSVVTDTVNHRGTSTSSGGGGGGGDSNSGPTTQAPSPSGQAPNTGNVPQQSVTQLLH